MNATISTHVLDTARGVPAAGIPVTLARIDGTSRSAIGKRTTNTDGRTDTPLGKELEPGIYEIVFDVAHYLGTHAFYDEITVRVVLDGARERYHVPLLLAPYGYATYRGS
jgi:5-hydroxyisourate hydrolase